MLLGTTALLLPGVGSASSHREAPLIAGDPRADNTDTYAFVSPDKPDTVTLLANWIPFQEPNGGPNFYPFAEDARYNILVDNVGDAMPHVKYTWTFKNNYRDDSGQFLYNTGPVKSLTDKNLNFFQTYKLTVTRDGETKTLVNDGIVAPSHTGKASMPDYAKLRREAVKKIEGNEGVAFAGQADDSFFLDLRVFDLLYGTDLKSSGQDTLTGYNVNTLAVQVPKDLLAAKGDSKGNPVIGVWSTTERRSADVNGSGSDEFTQVSRLGNPLVNEVVVPVKLKDAFNGLTPDKDATVAPVVEKVLDPIVPKLIESIYKLPAPATPRNDLFEIFLTGICKECAGPDGNVALPIDLNSQMLNKDGRKGAEFQPSEMLRLNMSIPPTANPNRLGVLAKDLAGFPNGRRLTDDVVDIALQAVEGAAQTGQLVEALAAGDGVNQNELPFGSSFPYVALPHSADVNRAAGGGTANTAASSSAAPAAPAAPAARAAGTEVAANSTAPTGGVGAGAGGTSDSDSMPIVPILAVVIGLLMAGSVIYLLTRKISTE